MPLSIGFFAPSVTHIIETMAFYVAREGHQPFLVTKSAGDETSEHPWALRRIRQAGSMAITDIGAEPRSCDMLVFELVRHGRVSGALAGWRSKARKTAFLLEVSEQDKLRDRLRELVRSWPHYVGAAKAISVRTPAARWRDFPFLLQGPVYCCPYLHPQLCGEAELEAVFRPVDPLSPRPFRAGFIGNRNPPERMLQLEQCRAAIDQAGAMVADRDSFRATAAGDDQARAVWIEYGNDAGPRGLAAMDYIGLLADVDFCISPPGWGMQWTHRTVECVVRGAIPIIMDPHLYNVGFRDGENCLVVRDGDWHGATLRALQMPAADVRRMRAAALDLRDRQLTPSAVSRSFCAQLLA